MALLEAIGAGSAIAGTIGSFFGGQETELPPQLARLFEVLEGRAEEGISEEEEQRLLAQLTGRLGSEFSALSSLTGQQLQRRGAGVGVQQAASERLSEQRFGALGQGISNIAAADERAKQSALSNLTSLSGLLPQFTSDTGGGFADLAGAGFDILSIQSLQDDNKRLLESFSPKTNQFKPTSLAGVSPFLGR